MTRVLRSLDGDHDVTMAISGYGREGTIMVAVDGASVFLGLERPDGLFQFSSVRRDRMRSSRPFTIGGQEADIETQHLLDLDTASIVIDEWLTGRDASAQGVWERR